MADQELDARGLTCPLPVMRTAKLMLTIKVGQTLRVLATDPATVIDFDAYARGSGNVLLESKKTPAGEFEFLLKRV
ncbi:MAG: sulfurtransferase TusA family protein [Sulfuricaulis sp.]|uniref:sulfurtransferase TusA family protein n=1 Tax=Sulfuricaulis sp. TaxID=2003553 RepID=UPI0025CBA631|nr:sulfurtransferase TusA family protein [Sulfuricaulis sp.]MCR4345887.1 sulfurtransferase TusA family protein [Sulfuricaulis sp.]